MPAPSSTAYRLNLKNQKELIRVRHSARRQRRRRRLHRAGVPPAFRRVCRRRTYGWSSLATGTRGNRSVKVAPWPSPALSRVDGAAVQLDEVAHDRQARARGRRARASVAAVGLPEPLEHVRQEVGRDADARCR